MPDMNRLASLIEKKRKAQLEVPKAEHREAKRLQAEHEPVGQARAKEDELASPISKNSETVAPDPQTPASLPPADVKRRLRLLGQPVTLFGEDEAARERRLKKAEEEVQVEDEHISGQQAYSFRELHKEKRERERLEKLKAAHAVGPQITALDIVAGGDPEKAGDASEPEDPTAEEFARAAAMLKEKLEEQSMVIEDKISKYLKKYCELWGEDLDRRSEENKNTGSGRQATLQYQQTLSYFKPLYSQLKRRQVPPEMVAGLWMFIEDLQNRNYLHAYDIYMHLAVGNAPWPIGVTSIGIHDRSAREKIGHTMNAAHIMNDEATRKYLQGIKRLSTFMQRAFPTDPSRSVDFDGFKDAGRGAAGSGSDKMALLQAEQRGETPVGLLPAPHHLDTDGSVKVPDKWENMVRRSDAFKEKTQSKTPPRTPPRIPSSSVPSL